MKPRLRVFLFSPPPPARGAAHSPVRAMPAAAIVAFALTRGALLRSPRRKKPRAKASSPSRVAPARVSFLSPPRARGAAHSPVRAMPTAAIVSVALTRGALLRSPRRKKPCAKASSPSRVACLRAVAYDSRALRKPLHVLQQQLSLCWSSRKGLFYSARERESEYSAASRCLSKKQQHILEGCVGASGRPLGAARQLVNIFRRVRWTRGSRSRVRVQNRLHAQFGTSPCSDPSGYPKGPPQSRRRTRDT